MSAKRKRRNPYSWQLARLRDFVEQEREDARFFEAYCEKTARTIPFQVLSVMLFILKDEYTKKPGALVALYRAAHRDDMLCADFETRYGTYYFTLQERGYL